MKDLYFLKRLNGGTLATVWQRHFLTPMKRAIGCLVIFWHQSLIYMEERLGLKCESDYKLGQKWDGAEMPDERGMPIFWNFKSNCM